MFYSRALVLTAVAALSGCSRAPESAPAQPYAVLRFDNLSGDRSLDWMERAAARQLAWQLPGGIAADSPDPAADRTRARTGKARVVRGWVSKEHGKLTLAVEVEDPASIRATGRETVSGTDGLIVLTSSLARAIDARARPPATASEEALRLFAQALDAPGSGGFAAAIGADPAFPLPYRSWIEEAAARRDTAAAAEVVERIRAAGDRLPRELGLQIEVEAATAGGTLKTPLSPLAELAELKPDDPAGWTRLGQASIAARRYEDAARHFERALQLAPPVPGVLWNQLGYARALAGEREEALRAFSEYQRLHSEQANPLDSQGEAAFWFGDFGRAREQFEQAYAAEPGHFQGLALLKAAQSAAFAGDREATARLLERYFTEHAPTSAWQHDLFLAEWEIARGEREPARQRLEAISGPAGPAASLILAGLSLDEGNREGAARRLAAVAGQAGGPALAIVAFAAAPPATPEEWRRRADRAFPSPIMDLMKRIALAWALLFDRHFSEADAVLAEIEEMTPGTVNDTVPVLRAWALTSLGRQDQAAPRIRHTPMLPVQTPAPFPAIAAGKLSALRAGTEGRR